MAADPQVVESQQDRLGMWASLSLRARYDAVWFAREILQLKPMNGEPTLDEDPNASWELDLWQVEMMNACCDVARKRAGFPTVCNHDGHQLISIRACQGPGKTFGAAVLMHWFNFAFPGRIVATAPKIQQVTSRLWNEFRKVAERAAPGYRELFEVGATSITWAGDPKWFAVAETGAQPENLQGFHDKYIMVIADEASGVDEAIFPVLRGALSTGVVPIGLLIGNPTQNIGTFYDSHMREDVRRDFYTMHVSIANSKRVSREWADAMIRSYGNDSPAVRVRVYGEFADSGEGQLIPLLWISNARRHAVDPMKGDGSLPRWRISVDVADGGEDKTVITVGRHYDTVRCMLYQREYSFPAAEAPIRAADEVERLWHLHNCHRDNADDIVVDSLGVGAGTAGSLLDRGLPVVTYRGGESSDDPSQWRNRRVQSYLALRNDFRDGRIALADDMTPEWADFEAQLCSIKVRPGTERVEDLITKDEMKRKGFKSPDRADSLAMQYATQAPRLTLQATQRTGLHVVTSNLWDGM